MEYKILENKYQKCCQLVTNKQLAEAFLTLKELIDISKNSDLFNQLETYRETYKNILTYSFGEFEDPEKETVYYHLLRNLTELADTVKNEIISNDSMLSYVYIKKDPDKILPRTFDNPQNFIDSLSWNYEIEEISNHVNSENSYRQEHQKNVAQLFNHLWLTNKYLETEKELVLAGIKSQSLPWWEKCLIISAVTLSLQRHFDETKLYLLIEAYNNSEHQVYQRALVALIICLYQYQQRLYLYPNLKKQIDQLTESTLLQKHAEMVFIQFIKAMDTEKIASKFREEIIPEMTKIHSRISDKLDLKNLIQETGFEEKNPDWEHVFHDSPNLLNKLEELSMLQMEGSDVFMGTFSMLKQFDFFNDINNWFLPYFKENPYLKEVLKDDTGTFDAEKFTENMERSSIMCNSDKYSFSLNMQHIPKEQRSMMVEMFNMEVNTMDELAKDDDALNKPTRERVIFTQYIQDLYRFNKLYRNKHEFYEIFSTRTDFHNAPFFRWFIKDDETARNIGEFYFEKEHFRDAIDIFIQLDTQSSNFELWQKIAYGWQKLGDYEKALEYYLKADLADTRKTWNIKKIALCYRRLGNYPKALDYYLDAEKMEPDDLQLQANIAHTYLDLKDYDNALKKYFKVEYLAPANQKIQRPIAWCSFMLEKLDTAKKYFEKILQTEGNQNDLLNLGHIEWCLGNKKQAILRYKESLEKSGNNTIWFTEEFMADGEILIRYGINAIDIPLMRDFVVLN